MIPALVAIAAGMLLVLAAGRLDRRLLRARLQVLDGGVGHEDIEFTEAASGDRS